MVRCFVVGLCFSLLVAACAPDGPDDAAATSIPATSTTLAVSSTSVVIEQPTSTASTEPPQSGDAEDAFMEHPLGLYDASVWMDGLEVLFFTHEAAGFDPGMAAAGSGDLESLVDRYYARLWEPELGMVPEPSKMGGLDGLLAREARAPEGHESLKGSCDPVIFAVDDAWVYAVGYVNPSPAFDPDEERCVSDAELDQFTAQVADLSLPVTAPVPPFPVAATDWVVASGDVLVASEAGLAILRRDSVAWSEVSRVFDTPIRRAYSDGGSGVVFQQPAQFRMSERIWWLPEPGADPLLVADLEAASNPYLAPYGTIELLGVEDVDGDRQVLYQRGDWDPALYSYSLDTGRTELIVDQAAEITIRCATWANNQYVYTDTPWDTAYVTGVTDDEPASIPVETDSDEPWEPNQMCIAPDTGSKALVGFRHSSEPEVACTDDLSPAIGLLDLATGTLIGPIIDVPVDTDECWVSTLDRRDDEALMWLGTRTHHINLSTGEIALLPIVGSGAFVP